MRGFPFIRNEHLILPGKEPGAQKNSPESMALSLTCARPFHLPESEHQPLVKLPPRHPISWAPSPSAGSSRFSASGGNPSLPRSRFRPRSARTEEGDTSPTTQTPEVENLSKGSGGSPASSFLSVLCPLLKLFSGTDPSQERNEYLEVATSSLSSLARSPWGSRSLISRTYNRDTAGSPSHLQLYEFEACPFCRRVREAMTELDLSVKVYPCPKGSSRHREMVRKIGGKEQFPFLVDLNTGISMYESGDIVKYLFQQYGQGKTPTFGLLESTLFTGWVPTLLRAGRGMAAWDRSILQPPSEMLELFSYENNPYARIVREALCELELPYILHNVGKGSSKSELLLKMSGSDQVPYLIDPNTSIQMGDYKMILAHLFQTYAAS